MDRKTGRFITMDPHFDGTNWYAYTANRPTGRTDPTGLHSDDECATECQKAFLNDLDECAKKSKKCKKLCICSLILYPICVYYGCVPKYIECKGEAIAEDHLCTDWCVDPNDHPGGPHAPNPYAD